MMTMTSRVLGAALVALVSACPGLAQEWKPVPGRIMTRWAKDVTPDKVWPEYPRPTMVREKWINLNGLWSYNIVKGDAPGRQAEAAKILVPFPPESSLSGVGRVVQPDESLWYWRRFAVPADWKSQRVLLHFGAVDWHAKVSINGKAVGEHKGGFDPFIFDVTESLKPGENELTVRVQDPTDTGGQPRGKQWLKPHGIWYTPTSGIWQTVWLEPVPRTYISSIKAAPDLATGSVMLRIDAKWGPAKQIEIDGTVFAGKEPVTKFTRNLEVPPGQQRLIEPMERKIRIENPRVWSPEDPFLYDVVVSVTVDGVVDEVRTYFAFRDIAVAKDDRGINRLKLNGKPVFHFGPLDQGFWPDGLYTPPTDEAMKFDIEAVKKMGGNMLRKHVKVESERFYHWCDKLGVMVWQDMPSPFFKGSDPKDTHPALTDAWKSNFENEWLSIIRSFSKHPSIVMWVPFNEGWGQNDFDWCEKVIKMTEDADPSRPVNNASGWTDMKVGHVIDIHDYPGPAMAAVEPARASVLGEFGGLGLPIEGHTWVEKNNWGYVNYKNKEELTEAYVGLLQQMPLLIGQGLSAAVYTQTTDVEIECNGWLTYDREVWKIDPAQAAAAARALYLPPPSVTTVLRRAGEGDPATWRYTTDRPGDDWFKSSFDDASWPQGAAGFGTRGTPGAVIGTEWKGGEIWLRRTFDLPEGKLQYPYLSIHHDEDAEVYINGELAASFKRWTSSYRVVPLSDAAAKLLKPGTNTLAIHCKQTGGGQYILRAGGCAGRGGGRRGGQEVAG